MKAIVYTEYGGPSVLRLEELEKPTPKDDEVLIKIHAASVNDWDWGLLRDKPFANRLIYSGLLKPKIQILGCEIAGEVELVGRNVKEFQPGDEVLGDISRCRWGGFAEYVCARSNAVVLKPDSMTFDEAAAIPQAALLALQGLQDRGQIKPGQKVLINGAGGGAGTFAIQIAKSFGTEVTGVDNTRKLDIMRSIGADHVIDYTQENFSKNDKRYDLILDFAAYHSILNYSRALNPKGVYIIAGGSTLIFQQVIFIGPLILTTTNKKMIFLMHKPNEGLAFIIKLFKDGKLKPVIDKSYPLSEVPEALRYFGEGKARGKVIITMF